MLNTLNGSANKDVLVALFTNPDGTFAADLGLDLSLLLDVTEANGLVGNPDIANVTILLDDVLSGLLGILGSPPIVSEAPVLAVGMADDDIILGSLGGDEIHAGSGDDSVWGMNGDDTLIAGDGTDLLFGGAGDDIYILGSASDIASEAEDAGFDTVVADFDLDLRLINENIEAIALTGDTDANLTGNDAVNVLTGNSGDNVLRGLDGADILYGGDGNDVLDGGADADRLFGGLGNDTYVLDNAGDTIEGEIGFSLGGGVDTVRAFLDHTLINNIEILRLSNQTDTTQLNGVGNDAPNTLVGNNGHNELNGRGGNDQINGNDGDDVLVGGEGADTLVGGSGADTFVLSSISNSRAGAGTRDVVNGFSHGHDTIDLAAIDADTTTFGLDDAFNFIGMDQFDGTAGQMRTQSLGGLDAILIEADINGDTIADMQVLVLGTDWMTGSDFIL